MGIGASSGIRSSDPLPFNQTNAVPGLFQPMEPLKPNDFQKFVLETAGYKLPLYGQAFLKTCSLCNVTSCKTSPAHHLSRPLRARLSVPTTP